VYDFQEDVLVKRVRQFIEDYNSEVDRYNRSGRKEPVDDFVRYEKIKWSRDLKLDLQRGHSAVFDESKLRTSLYRAYCKRKLFFDRVLNEEVYGIPRIFPNPATESENCLICCTIDSQIAFSALITDIIPSHAPGGRPGQCFPFYFYNEDGTNRRENITDWALEHFRKHYRDETITKWDIFYYVYGVLHHPEYRAIYAENLKRELPRIPLAKDFRAIADAGKELAQLHVDYEKLEPYPLKFLENKDLPLSYRVEDKMRLSKDRKSLKVSESLTLEGIPPETFEYRLGNRSALEWVIDQYRVTEDKLSGLRSDPNRPEDPEYILRLVGQVIRVSLETVRIVGAINALPLA
jgi:predicted helicase